MTSEHDQPTVLDVGQCSLDNGNITQLLSVEFGATVEKADSIEQAVEAIKRGNFDLVLVNRIFDQDGTEGLELLRRLKGENATASTPVMLVSNFPDAQEAAVSLGALPGFGKNALDTQETKELLAKALKTQVQNR